MSKRTAAILLGGVLVASAYFTMTVIIRGESVEVPSVAGASLWNAQQIVGPKRLNVKERDRRYNDRVPEGHVIEQDPPAGELVKRGRTIWVVVSRGSESVAVPDLRDQSLQQAKVKLQLNGLLMGQVARVESRAAADTVVAQNPEPPTSAGRGSVVNLLLSSGPAPTAYLMPDLGSIGVGEAKRLIHRMGVAKRRVRYQPHEEVPAGRLAAQTPLPGARVSSSDVVELIVSLGNAVERPTVRQLPISFEVPRDGAPMRHVRIVLVDDEGEQVLLNEVRPSGDEVQLRPKVRGEAFIEIYLDNGGDPVEEIRS